MIYPRTNAGIYLIILLHPIWRRIKLYKLSLSSKLACGFNVVVPRVLPSLKFRYMKRRCAFLDICPGFNYNTGSSDYVTNAQGKREKNDTTQLGSTLMDTMLKEVGDFCDPFIRENWAMKPHHQVCCMCMRIGIYWCRTMYHSKLHAKNIVLYRNIYYKNNSSIYMCSCLEVMTCVSVERVILETRLIKWMIAGVCLSGDFKLDQCFTEHMCVHFCTYM